MITSFTTRANPAIEAQIQKDLNAIQARLLNTFDGVEGLVLVGGFGRGEGGVVFKNGRYCPENDYDLDMITAQMVESRRLKPVEKDLADHLGLRWVHIETRPRSALATLPFTQYVFDMKYGGYLLHGPPDLLDEIPPMRSQEMPLAEGEKLLHTRLWCFLGPYTSAFEHRAPTQSESNFLISQMAKALLCICDTELMLRRAYQLRYADKGARFASDSDAPAEIKHLIAWAVAHKLRPDEVQMPEAMALYRKTRIYFLNHMFHFVQCARKRKFGTWLDYAHTFHGWVSPHPRKTALKRTINTWLGRAAPDGRHIDLLRLKLLLVAAGVDPDTYLLPCREIAQNLSQQNTTCWDWDTLRNYALDLLGI